MNGLQRRIERLENKFGVKPEPRLLVMTNVAPSKDEGTRYCARIGSDRWAHTIRGGPFTDEEIRKLREDYSEERHRREYR
jgi:hypothetical protein